jgi:hypothetical protein
MVKSKRELFENARKRWPEEVRILEVQPNIDNSIHTGPCSIEIYDEIEKSIDIYDNWNCIAAWSFHQAAGKLGRRKYKKSERILRFKDVSFNSFNTKMISNLAEDKWGDDWKDEREIYLKLPIGLRRHPQ